VRNRQYARCILIVPAGYVKSRNHLQAETKTGRINSDLLLYQIEFIEKSSGKCDALKNVLAQSADKASGVRTDCRCALLKFARAFRVASFGIWSLAEKENVIAKSITNILRH